MQYWSKPLLLLCLAVGLFSLTRCSKPSELGLTLIEQNPSDIFFTDTLSLNMSSVATDPLPTNERSRWLCGAYVDPIFGLTEIGIYSNFRLTSTNVTFPGCTFDSLVLSMAYDSLGHYGGNMSNIGMQHWEVYRVEEDIIQGKEYFSNQTFTLGDFLGSKSFVPAIRDSVTVQGVKYRPQVRIRLDDALGQKLLAPDSSIYDNNSKFKSFLKGIYIRPVPGANNTAILRFFPNSTQTKLSLYYTDSSGVARVFNYSADDDAESTLHIKHNYSGTSILDNNPSDTVVYIQGANGPSVRVSLPSLASLGKVIINKAELYVYVAGQEDRNYPIPDQLFCLEKTTDGSYLLIDDVLTSIQRNSFDPYRLFGGLLSKDGPKRFFRMNLSQFLQRMVDNELDENAVYIQPAAVTDTKRMLLGNQNSPTLKAKLYLTYTKIN